MIDWEIEATRASLPVILWMIVSELSQHTMSIKPYQTSTIVIVKGASFSADDSRHIRNQLIVKSSTHQNRLRKRRGHAERPMVGEVDTRRFCDAMKSLLPPCVRWQAKSGDSRTHVTGVVQLFCHGERFDECGCSSERICKTGSTSIRWNVVKTSITKRQIAYFVLGERSFGAVWKASPFELSR